MGDKIKDDGMCGRVTRIGEMKHAKILVEK
jgi:hypothetical protein